MSRKALSTALVASLLLCLALQTLPALAGPQPQWADLVTGVDANGNLITTRVYGYYADVEGFGRVFVVCDPATGRETGEAYVPGAKVGDRQVQKLVRYERKLDLDWDHPKQVNPVRLSLIAPNIPTDVRYDWDYYERTGQLVEKTFNQFAWPMSWSFARMIPGSDPDYWLILGVLQNPNPYPVRVNMHASIWAWHRSWSYDSLVRKELQEVPLGPNETKYVLLNRGQKGEFLADRLWFKWPQPGYSEAYYSVQVRRVDDPEYPEILKSGDAYGFFVPYVRWDGTDPTVYLLIPMRLAFDFYCWSDDDYGSYWYSYYRGREFPECWGHAEHDPATGQWTVSVSFYYFEKPWWMSNEEWQKVYNTAVNKAVSALKSLFEKWYPKVPFWCVWWDDPYLKVNGETGEYITYDNWPGGREPSFRITFQYLEPVPPRNAPPPPDSQYWWIDRRWCGWLYTAGGAYAYGSQLTAPVLFSYPYSRGIEEFNFTTYTCSERDGGTSSFVVPAGTGIYDRTTDLRYYDPDGWMRYLPVVRAQPMFVEWYRFVPTQGDFGYLTKEVVPGYQLWVDTETRPVLSVATQPIEVSVDWWCWAHVSSGRSSGIAQFHRYWRWTPQSGWQFLGQSHESATPISDQRDSRWKVTVRYAHRVTGSNPNDFPVLWRAQWGNSPPALYWPGAQALREKGNNVSVDPLIPLSGNPYLGANEQNKLIASCEKTASLELARERQRGESFESFESRVLSEVVSGIVQPVFSSQEEAVFEGGGRFAIVPTFEPGRGGVIGGAQKYLIHYHYVWDSKWDWYVWDDPEDDVIGFPGANMTLCSYISPWSPMDGLVVRAGDEYFAELLRRKSTEILFNSGSTLAQRLWRFHSEGVVYPPPYPED